MLYRVVRMVFSEITKSDFVKIFYAKQSAIEASEGCIEVFLMQDERDPMAMATWSLWKEEKYLDQYRNSELFIVTWEEVKPLFTERARAWSFTKHVRDESA